MASTAERKEYPISMRLPEPGAASGPASLRPPCGAPAGSPARSPIPSPPPAPGGRDLPAPAALGGGARVAGPSPRGGHNAGFVSAASANGSHFNSVAEPELGDRGTPTAPGREGPDMSTIPNEAVR